MAYIELNDILIRGTLRGASGKARFKLTANQINAINTLNIKNGQVTYSYHFSYSNKEVTSGSAMLSATISVLDEGAFIEVLASADGASSVKIDGATRPTRNRRGPNSLIMPFVEIVKLAPGTHTISIISGRTGTSKRGYILCRYIRRTGSDNT